jgi:transglutaminase-like putative cysteine protease
MLPRFAFVSPLFLAVLSIISFAQTTRHFTFHYGFSVENIPLGESVRVWAPLAQSDEFQDVKVISATGDLPLKKARESRYGNGMYYAEADKASRTALHFEIVYDVVRRERLTLGVQTPHLAAMTLNKKEEREFLAPDKLVPTSGLPAELAAKVTAGKATTLEKARAIYDYVFSTMRYDKSGTGWGNGDVLWACDSKRGNCTDFHSVFIAMARSQSIPARFEIGFPLPSDMHAGEIAGYHCWAEFFDPEHGWVPVDISEAWKHQEKKDYFFGAHDENRFQLSKGRDLTLSPRQDGNALNYFVYPYVEIGGKPYSSVSKAFSFADAAASVARR